MKRNFLLITLLFAMSALLGVLAGILYIKNSTPQISYAETPTHSIAPSQIVPPFVNSSTPEETPPAEAPVFDSEQYVVTISDTKILIYKISHDGSMQTIEEKHIDTGSIPRDDYAKLYSGIIVATLEEAKQIVEDYIS